MTHPLRHAAAAVLTLVTLLAVTGCENAQEARRAAERTVLASQIHESDAARALASQALVAHGRQVQAINDELGGLQSEAAELRRRVQSFMMEHKMAVAALAAGAAGGLAALDDSGRVAQEAREVGAAVSFAAAVWAAFNMEEVLQVADQLVKADAALSNLGRRQATLTQALATEQGLQQDAQATLDRINAQASGLRTALASL